MKENGIKILITGAIAAAAAYFDVMLLPLVVLCTVMACDYITGVIGAWHKGELSSRVGWYGIVKKVCYLFAVAVGMVVDYVCMSALMQIHIDIGAVHLFGMLVIVWLILNELLSILENLDEIGVPLPGWLKVIVDRLVNNIDETEKLGIEEEDTDGDNDDDFSV